MSGGRQLAFEFGSPNQSQFVLDGRCVEFPEGLRTAEFTHTIHRFPGKFVPQVARELLRLVGATNVSLIADPFCGSGTSLIEASLLGIPAIGLDLDPLAVLISRAKTVPLSPRQLFEIKNYWAGSIGSADIGGLADAVPRLYHWFRPETANQLAFIKKKTLAIEDATQRLFSLVVFSSIIRRVSNADDQTQKTYVSGTLKKTPPSPRDLFPLFLDKALRGMVAYAKRQPTLASVERGDARNWRSPTKLEGIVTSPPYIDSIDYVYNQMLEYFWLYEELGLSSVGELKRLRKEPIGLRRANIDMSLRSLATRSRLAFQLLEPILADILKISEKEAENVAGYFDDFAQHIESAKTTMSRGAIYALVVGESLIRGVTVPTPAILTALFRSSGFESMGTCSYVIKRHYMKFPRRLNSGRINIDHVLCFNSP
jgi:hypothetical protein